MSEKRTCIGLEHHLPPSSVKCPEWNFTLLRLESCDVEGFGVQVILPRLSRIPDQTFAHKCVIWNSQNDMQNITTAGAGHSPNTAMRSGLSFRPADQTKATMELEVLEGADVATDTPLHWRAS